MDTPFTIAGRTFRSRLIVGTGKFPSPEVMVAAHAASGAEMVTVAVRRVRLPGRPTDEAQQAILEYIDTDRYMLLPNTAGCYTADDAIRTARLGREAGLSEWVKLEVIGDERTLFPDNAALVEATAVLVKDGFVVLPLHERRSGYLPQAGGRRRRRCDAARRADRLRPRDSEPGTTFGSSGSSRRSR